MVDSAQPRPWRIAVAKSISAHLVIPANPWPYLPTPPAVSGPRGSQVRRYFSGAPRGEGELPGRPVQRLIACSTCYRGLPPPPHMNPEARDGAGEADIANVTLFKGRGDGALAVEHLLLGRFVFLVGISMARVVARLSPESRPTAAISPKFA